MRKGDWSLWVFVVETYFVLCEAENEILYIIYKNVITL
jgi:hypothetical protein